MRAMPFNLFTNNCRWQAAACMEVAKKERASMWSSYARRFVTAHAPQ